MLVQLISYYTIDRGSKQTLWEYLAWTVIIFQNAAVLEVIKKLNLKLKKKNSCARAGT
jgi:hypothetical protein